MDEANDDARGFTLSAYIFPSSLHFIYTNQPKALVTSDVIAGCVNRIVRRLEMNIPNYSAEGNVPNLGESRAD
jgi:hypothetical protein